MTRVVHLVVGPDEHGVVRHGVQVAAACGHGVARLPDAAAAVTSVAGGLSADVVHVPFTDRLFGVTGEQALAAFTELSAGVRAAGAELSVTLHDIPCGTDELSARRRGVYHGVIARARGVVVNSRVELAEVQDAAAGVHSLRHVDLPVDAAPAGPRPEHTDGDAVVLGFVFPDRGYEQVLHALPPGGGLLALGRAAAGHEQLPDRLAGLAAELGRRWQVTGFVPDAELGLRLRRAAVPIAPNRRVTASGSVGTWLAHGRRPLVPDVPYLREFAARIPGALTLYAPGELAAAIARAHGDPASTWLPPDVQLGPSTQDVAAAYRSHLAACAPPRAVRGTDGVVRVPGNRWDLLDTGLVDTGLVDTGDLLDTADEPAVRVSVIIPWYADQPALERALTALTMQTVAGQLEVIVADDGSPQPPDVGAAGRLPVRVVRQARRGFGAARARNLGAAAARGRVLAFLDADMVPEPDYLRQLVRLPSAHADVLTVGRRRHAELSGWDAWRVAAWLAGERAEPEPGPTSGPTVLPEPGWLADAYRDSADLLHADERSYRFVISAVLATSRALFERLGGFDERFEHYGGEDWELAHRAWTAGALFAHVPAAVAWHDGPDWAGRAAGSAGADRAAIQRQRNLETATLSRLLPDPVARGGGQWLPYVHAIVALPGDDPAAVLATARSAFASGADCGVWLRGPHAATTVAALGDPRIQLWPPPPDVRARAAVQVELRAPCDLGDLPALCACTVRRGTVHTPAGVAVCTRAAHRAAPDDLGWAFGRHDRATPVPFGELDLAHRLTRSAQPVRRS